MKKLYSFKDHPEHEAQLGAWAQRWIANAMSTTAMTEEDREICRRAVVGLYAAASLPPPKHIVFVPSPFVLAFAGGFAAARWHMAKTGFNPATRAATAAATRATDAVTRATRATVVATRAATAAATRATVAATRATRATVVATRAAADAAADAATDAVTRATYAATRATVAATGDVDLSNWYVVPADMRRLADELGVGQFGLLCAARAWAMRQGGNQWPGWDSYLSFFKDVAGLNLPQYAAYQHWQDLAEHAGPRIMHPDFCMISDRPSVLCVDDQKRPHCEDGPFCEWRDGSALYAWHGTHIPANWVIHRESIDPTEILRCENVEQRAAGAACIGWLRMLSALDYKIIDADADPSHGELIELRLEGLPSPGRFLKAECPRNGLICEGLPPVSDIDGKPINTVLAAQAWRVGLASSDFSYPAIRT